MVATHWRDKLIRIHRRLYERNLRLVRESVGHNPSVDRYAREYRAYLQRYQCISTKGELFKRLHTADIVYHGDYHTLNQSQRSVLRILRELLDRRSVVLCLEMFHGEDQDHLDAYMSGQLDAVSFRKRIDYARKWPFSWKYWSPILELCKAQCVKVLGINSIGQDSRWGIKSRDAYASKIIGRTLLSHPGHLIYVVAGDYHVCPPHLPAQVEKRLRIFDVEAKRLILYQNAENLYWQLAKEGHEEVDVLQIGDDSFCLMNTMPANKIQSYLNWLDFCEDAYYPVNGDLVEPSGELSGISIQQMVRTIDKLLALDLPADALDRLTVYYANDLDFLEMIESKAVLRSHGEIIRRKIAMGEGFLLEYPEESELSYLVYLPSSSINMAAEEAAHFINLQLRGPLQDELSPFDFFYRNVMTECLGFFGSKLINEKRKPVSEYSLRNFLGKVRRKESEGIDEDEVRLARLLLQHHHLERQTTHTRRYEKKFSAVFEELGGMGQRLSTQLGYMLGNKLYYGVKKGNVPLEEVRQLFREPFVEPNLAFITYQVISLRLRGFRQPPQI